MSSNRIYLAIVKRHHLLFYKCIGQKNRITYRNREVVNLEIYITMTNNI